LRGGGGPYIFSVQRFQRLIVEREIGDQMLQPPILVLERFQPPRFADIEPAVLALPAMVRLLADAVPANDVADLRACVHFAQYADDLLLRESTLPHGSSSGRTPIIAGSVSRGQVTTSPSILGRNRTRMKRSGSIG